MGIMKRMVLWEVLAEHLCTSGCLTNFTKRISDSEGVPYPYARHATENETEGGEAEEYGGVGGWIPEMAYWLLGIKK